MLNFGGCPAATQFDPNDPNSLTDPNALVGGPGDRNPNGGGNGNGTLSDDPAPTANPNDPTPTGPPVPGNPADANENDNEILVPAESLIAATQKAAPVTITLTATPRNSRVLLFEIVDTPANGTLGPVISTSPTSADVTFTPAGAFVGRTSFRYRAGDGGGVSAERTVEVIVYPEVRFTVAPASGMRNLDVTATAFTGGDALPEASFRWQFEEGGINEVTTGQPQQHFTFTSGGRHEVRLALVLLGYATPIACLSGQSGSADVFLVTVNPIVSGRIVNAQSVPQAGVRVDAMGTNLTTTTDANGNWSLTVDYGWTGEVRASRAGSQFTPPSWNLASVTRDQAGIDFRADPVAPQNTAPTANNGSATHVEDVQGNTTLTGSDAESNPLTFIVASLPAHGSLRDGSDNHLIVSNELPYTLRNGGAVVKYLSASNYNGADAFTFRVSDAQLTSPPATISVTVTPVNDAPLAMPQSVLVQSGLPTGVTLSALDVEGSPLTYTIVTSPAHGTLSGTAPNVTFTPAAGYSGADSFAFRANDGQLNSANAAVSVTIASGSWRSPVGIPTPSFGLFETAPTAPNPWNGTVAGFYYVDNTHAQATDSSNSNGYPSRPRRTIPLNLPAGSVVEVRGGPYTYGNLHGSTVLGISGNGTPAQPVFVRGGGPTNMPKIGKETQISGTYVIVEYIDFDRNAGSDNGGVWIDPPDHHLCVRRCEVQNRQGGPDTALSVGAWPAGSIWVHDVVFFQNKVHDNGDWQSDGDEDHRGIGVSANAYNIWILENEVWHHSADGIGLNAGYGQPNSIMHHVYVGRNHIHENKQGGFWTKESQDIVVSENTVWGHRVSSSSDGHAMGCQYSPQRVWFLYNDIFDNHRGIVSPGVEDCYVVGNTIHNIHHVGTTFDANSAYSAGAAMHFRNSGTVTVVGNTIYDCEMGITGVTCDALHIANNIFGDRTQSQARDIYVMYGATTDASDMNNNLFKGTVRISWGGASPVYNLAGFQSATGKGQGCLNADPLFVNAPQGDCHLQAGSPAINAGVLHSLYATFQSTYGVDLRFDRDGVARPQGGAWDIGAYER